MNEKEFELMEYLMKCNSQEKKKFIDNYLIQQYGKDKCVITKDYTLAFGDIPIGIVAHVDTVFEGSKKYKEYINLYYDQKRQVMFCPSSPGFDDTAGCYAIMELVKRGLRPTIILCEGEEKYCDGAIKLTKDILKCPIDLKYIIELDRQGFCDCVFYDCVNNEFEDYIESCGFKTDYGSFSDISIIGPIWGIACVNISIGYEEEHTYSEILHVNWMLATIEKVIVMLKNSLREEYNVPHFEYVERKLEWESSDKISKEDWFKYFGGKVDG